MVKKKNSKKEIKLLEILKKFSPGTAMRTALDDLLRARMGALIVFDKESLSNIISGGFKINTKFTSQKLIELAKMDGAIIISDDIKKIIYVNTLLSPNVSISTKETGTRHQAAERTAKQLSTITIAVSERRNKISIYYCDERHELESTSEILRRATEILQVLEKQKELFDESLINFNMLEINNLVTISDICNILQRIEIISRISSIVKRYLIELGKEGTIVSMRLKELTKNIAYQREMILKDYFRSKSNKADLTLKSMNFDFLIETPNISRILFEELHDKPVPSKGERILNKTSLNEKEIKLLFDNFRNLKDIFSSEREKLIRVFQNELFAEDILKELSSLKEKIMAGKNI